MESKITPKKIMISYGRADATDFVLELEKRLTDVGHTVWIDRSKEGDIYKIQAGNSWEEAIEDAINTHEVFLAIMSPHAIRRSEGVCLDEISMARFKPNKLIIPIMFKFVEPPLCIFRLDWIDFQKSLSENSVMSAGIDKLLSSIEVGKIAYEGQNKQFNKLKSLNFDAKLVALKKDFVGRKWIFDANNPSEGSLINDWLDGNSPIMMILGDPGIGKSAISAYLVEKHPSCIAYHFCIADDEETLNPNKFIKSIAHQMTSQLADEYRDKVLEEIDELPESPVSLFRTLISNPLSQLKVTDNKKYFIVVDGLDEASKFNSDNELLNLFSSNFINALPPHVRFIFTSRDEKNITSRFDAYNPYRLEASAEQNISDLKKYIEMMTNKYDIETLSNKDMESMIEKSEGSILYLKQIFEEVKNYNKKEIDITELPKGLFGIYEEYFSKTFKNEKKYSKYRKTLEVLVALYKPISKDLLAIILGKDEVKLKKIETFFPIDSNGNITAFHKSLLDWLIESPTYSVSEIDGHRRIIETTKLDFDDASELRIYIYSATKVFIKKQNMRDADVVEFFENKIAVNLEKLGSNNEDKNLIAKLKRLLIVDTEFNKIFKDKLDSLYVEESTLYQLKNRYENEDKEKWVNDYLSELSRLATLYKNNNKLQEAVALEEESLLIAKELYIDNPDRWAEDYTTSLNNLAETYTKQNRLSEAVALGEESLQTARKLYLENPEKGAENYTILLNNLANSYKNQNRFDEAIELQTQSLVILKSLYESNPDRWAEDYTTSLNNLAESYKKQNCLSEAVALGEESLQTARKLYLENPEKGAENYTILLNNLANSYKNQNRFNEAIELQTQSLVILKSLYESNPDRWVEYYTLLLNNLASSNYENNNIDEAIVLYEQSLEIRKALYQENPDRFVKDYTDSLNNLSVALFKLNKISESLNLLETQYGIFKDIFGPEDSRTLNVLQNLEDVRKFQPKKKQIEQNNINATLRDLLYLSKYIAKVNDEDQITLNIFVSAFGFIDFSEDAKSIFSQIIDLNTVGQYSDSQQYIEQVNDTQKIPYSEELKVLVYQLKEIFGDKPIGILR